jgi:hypothetical protein
MGGLRRGGDGADRHAQMAEMAGVADDEEGQPRAEPPPRRDRQFGADPGRLTHGQGDGRGIEPRTLTRRRRR